MSDGDVGWTSRSEDEQEGLERLNMTVEQAEKMHKALGDAISIMKNVPVLKNDNLLPAALDLYKACVAQHEAIDRLFAELAKVKPDFMPSKSGQPWEALLLGNAAMKQAEGVSDADSQSKTS